MLCSSRWIGQVALCLLLSGSAAAAAVAQDGGSAPAQQGTGQGYGNGQARRGGQGRGIRGTVVSTAGGNVTIKTEQGESWTVITTDNTRVNIDRQPVKIADLKAGDEVMAIGMPDADKHEVHAMMVAGASVAAVAKLKADLGKTYIVGRVTAIDDTRLTVLRPDKVSQTITLDDSTSLRRGGRMPGQELLGFAGEGGRGGFGGGGRRQGGGETNANSGGSPDANADGESITLADVKVGDNVGGTGSLKGGSFVPAELHVATPRAPRNGGAGGPGAGGPPPQQ